MSTIWLKPEQPVKRVWFRALERFAAAAAQSATLPRVNPDHFIYAARIERPGRTEIHVYRHLITNKTLYIDDDLNVYRFAGTDKHRNPKYVVLHSVGEAVDRLDLVRGNLLARHLRVNALVTPEEEEVRTQYPAPLAGASHDDGDPGPTAPPDDADEPGDAEPRDPGFELADLEVLTPALDPEARADAGFDDEAADTNAEFDPSAGATLVPEAIPA
jgi:hypothetical protein